MALNSSKIKERLQKLEEYLEFLRDIQKTKREKFIADPKEYYYAERILELSTQSVIDIGAHLVASLKLGKFEKNREIFPILAEHKIISHRLATSLENMASFRNILVHEYITINHEHVFEIIHTKTSDLEEFAFRVDDFISKQ